MALALSATPARAETVKARRSAPVYRSQGEKSEVITRVRAGRRMQVIKHDGRWVKVRANGQVGWIPRSYLQVRQARTPVRKKRRASFVDGRSRRHPARSAPRDRVGADVVEEDTISEFGDEDDARSRKPKRVAARDDGDLDEFAEGIEDDGDSSDDSSDDESLDEDVVVVEAKEADIYSRPRANTEPIDWAEKGDKLWVIDRDDDWILVEDEQGRRGWIRSSDVGAGSFHYQKWTKRASAGIGYANIGETFASSSTDPLGNYSISSGSMVIGLGGEVIYDYSKEWLLAGDGHFSYVRASPGIRYVDPNDMNVATDISFQQYKIDVGARAGYKLSKKNGMALYGRLGYHYAKLAIDNVSDFTVNIPKLPSEILSGVTVGAILDVPRFDPKWSGQAGLNFMLSSMGSLKQTQGLEDGNLSDTSAVFATARVNYQWKPNLKLSGTYQLGYAKTKWTGVAENSQRDHGAADARRTDMVHTLMVGLGRLF